MGDNTSIISFFSRLTSSKGFLGGFFVVVFSTADSFYLSNVLEKGQKWGFSTVSDKSSKQESLSLGNLFYEEQ